MRFARVDITGSTDPVSQVADSIGRVVPELRCGGIALVDSPGAPNAYASQRDLDVALRATISIINRGRSAGERITLALFPTPTVDYFARCANDRACKPHLIAIARNVLGAAPGRIAFRRAGGWLFTRFMLAGFAAHRALEQLGVDAFEAYPYLAFAMWKKSSELLPPKSVHRAALSARQKIVARLTHECALRTEVPQTLDQADAAVLAITARLSARDDERTMFFASSAHGRFMLALRTRDRVFLDRGGAIDRA